MYALLSLCAGLALLMAAKGSFISGSEEIGSPLRVAQCRANCLQKFSSGLQCLQGPDCFMCWENCQLLQSNFAVWGAMCAEKGICFPGCQQACRFYRETSKAHQSQPVIHTRGDEVVKVTADLATWPRVSTSDPNNPLVYVVVARSPGSSSWRQIVQTVDLSARLAEPLISLRVLVVDPAGLVTIYSPVAKRPALTSTTTTTPSPAASVNQQQRKKINTEITTRRPQHREWNLHQISLIHQKVLVIAEVAWTPRGEHAVYLVTWEVDGGGLKGNLFTDSTSVTLSLWPDTVYHIQVELVSRTTSDLGSDRSASLMIDTHRAEQVAIEATFLAAAALNRDRRPSTPSPTPRPPYIPAHIPAEDDVVIHPAMSSPLLSVLVKRSEVSDHLYADNRQLHLLAASGAASLLFVVLASLVAWRVRRASRGVDIRPQKLVEEATTDAFLKGAEKGARIEVQV